MDVLPANFRTLQILGLWHEERQRMQILKLLHTSLKILLVTHFTFFQLVSLVQARNKGMHAFTDSLYMSIAYVAVANKILNFVHHWSNLEDILDKFRLEICRPRDPEESAIARRYQTLAFRLLIVRLGLMSMHAFAFIHSRSIITGEVKQLPYNSYQMFNITGGLSFVLAYTLQIITASHAIGMDVCLDATACGFIILISGQLELLCYRMTTTGGKNVKDYVVHHNLIFIITKKVKTTFIRAILPAFFCGLLSLCSSTFRLAQANNTMSDYANFIVYLGLMLNQLYYFCWCGSELQLKSESVTDATFRSDWPSLSPLERRNYWYIMMMAQKELVISFHGQCSLNMITFIWMIKTSYGAYNLLQQVSD